MVADPSQKDFRIFGWSFNLKLALEIKGVCFIISVVLLYQRKPFEYV
jgi:hypothetical protein